MTSSLGASGQVSTGWNAQSTKMGDDHARCSEGVLQSSESGRSKHGSRETQRPAWSRVQPSGSAAMTGLGCSIART